MRHQYSETPEGILFLDTYSNNSATMTHEHADTWELNTREIHRILTNILDSFIIMGLQNLHVQVGVPK